MTRKNSTIKRDYVRVSPRPDAKTVMRQLPAWIAHYNEVHPHKLSDIVSPVSSSQLTQDPDRIRSFGGYSTLSQSLLGRDLRGADVGE
jgi:Integrase core domain